MLSAIFYIKRLGEKLLKTPVGKNASAFPRVFSRTPGSVLFYAE